MKNAVLSKTIFISLLGHIAFFSILSLSFGNRIPKSDYTCVSFWGQFLRSSQVSPPFLGGAGLSIKEFFIRKPDTLALDKSRTNALVRDKITRQSPLPTSYYLKPPLSLVSHTEKETFIKKSLPLLFSSRREPTIIFHPLLPYDFTLYFKDRQVAHVELMFNVLSTPLRNSIVIKRKISAGNLEVDLLVMRYIGHYLFIQKTCFTPNNWQTVKIDLSAKND